MVKAVCRPASGITDIGWISVVGRYDGVTSGIKEVRAWSGRVVCGANEVAMPASGRIVVVVVWGIKDDVASGRYVVVSGRANPWSTTWVVVNVCGVAALVWTYSIGWVIAPVI